MTHLYRSVFPVLSLTLIFGCRALGQTTLLDDDFSRGTTAAPLPLTGSSPTKGAGKWMGPAADDATRSMVTDGSGLAIKTVGSNTASAVIQVDQGLAPNTEYTWSVDVSSFTNQGDSWVGVGLGDQNTDPPVAGFFMRNEGGSWIMQKDGKIVFQDIFDRYSANDPTNPKEITKIKIVVNTGTKEVKFYLGGNKDEDFAYKYDEMPALTGGLYAYVRLFSGNGASAATNTARILRTSVTTSPVNPQSLQAEAALDALLKKIQDEFKGPPTDDSNPQPGVPHGEVISGKITDSKIYPGTENPFTVYVPAQYDPSKPACLFVNLDGLGGNVITVLDNLMAKKEIPVMIGLGVVPGTVWKTPGQEAYRFNRSYEFDSVNDHLAHYVLDELLPAVEKLTTKDGKPINISPDGNDHMVFGGSTGGIGSFNLAWTRPDAFRRVYSVIGTFVSMRGGHEYPALIRKTEPKPIRIFLEDGTTDAWNPLFGSWFMANENMEAALTFSGYDVQHIWADHGHDGRVGMVIFPDVMRWMWRDYPAAIQPGRTQNDMLRSLLIGGEGWQQVGDARTDVAGLASDQKGEIAFADNSAHVIDKLDASGNAVPYVQNAPVVSSAAFGPNGSLYVATPDEGKIVAYDAEGKSTQVADGVKAHAILVNQDGNVFATEQGEHLENPSKVWMIKPDGTKSEIDEGLSSASGLTFLPDKQMLFVAEATTKWVYSYVVNGDGTLVDKEPFYWLHMTDVPNDSGAQEMVVDTRGNLYVATRMGIQVCDRNGRVRGILPLPTPCGPVKSLCWSGEDFDTLVATDGQKIFKRKLNIHGYSQWSAPAALPPASGG